jgi:hypothetical protein
MSKIVKVSDDDYRIVVESGGTITLDTGSNAGGVVVTGNLSILGSVFDITTENTIVRDNIILLNGGEVGPGVTLNRQSGIEIDRGPGTPNAQLLFDETIIRPQTFLTQINAQGAFVLKTNNNNIVALKTNHINTGGQNLFLINQGDGVISVEGTNDYETKILLDDHIPNKKYVDDAIISRILNVEIGQIINGNSRLTVTTSPTPELLLRLNNVNRARWTATLHEVQNIRITDNRIEPATINTDLVLRSPGTGHVTIDDSMRIRKVPFTPPAISDSTIIYAKDSGRGESGIYFTSSDNNTGELISARRALAFSVIF